MLSDNIKRLRLAAKMNKAQLARAIDVSDVSVGYWENGTVEQIGHHSLLKLARVFNITVSELLDDPMLEETRRDHHRA